MVRSVIVVVVGIYLLGGAYFAFSTDKWPIFVPAQVDVVGFFLGNSNVFGVNLGGIFLTALGVALIATPFLSASKSDV